MSVRLSELEVGASARVVGYAYGSADESADGSDYAAQLTRLGLIPGTALEVRRVAPLGDPVEIRFRGFSLALRPREAACLLLTRT